MRLSNSDPMTGLNAANRVENEVTAMHLAREVEGLKGLVPDVYAWGSAGEGEQGWILMQHIDGEPLDSVYEELQDSADKQSILRQMAEITQALQSVAIPDSIEGFGGITFDKNGDIIAGERTTSLTHTGPFSSLSTMFQGILQAKLAEASTTPVLNGWPSLLPPLNALITDGVPSLLKNEQSESKRSLVHGDLTMNNMQYDKNSGRITALLDFDWAFVGHQLTDQLISLPTKLPGRYTAKESEDGRRLREALLTGHFPEPLPQSSDTDVDWETAKILYDCLADVGAVRLCDVDRGEVEVLAWLYEVADLLCPWALTNEFVVGMKGSERLAKERSEAEELLRRALDDWEAGKVGKKPGRNDMAIQALRPENDGPYKGASS